MFQGKGLRPGSPLVGEDGSINRKDEATGFSLQLALREARDFMMRRSFWVLHSCGVIMAAVAGPFYTLSSLSFTGRLVYWTVIIFFVGVLLSLFSVFARHLNRDAKGRDRLPWPVVITAASLAVVPIGLGAVWLMNIYFIGMPDDLPGWQLFSYVAVPVVILNLIVNATTEAERREARRLRAFDSQFGARFPEDEDEPPAPMARPDATVVPLPATEPPLPEPLLFEKLPTELGRELICLQAQDHYVQATTTRGTDQVLMRLSDAERDLTQFHGMRVHRSWWVNLAHVTDMARTENGGTELTTSNGMTIPVSRGQKAALRDALDERRRAAE